MRQVAGIDLGTTNSVIARVDDTGHASVIPNREGHPLTPSVILFTGGSYVVGDEAKNEAALNPQNFISNIKRQMCAVGPDGKPVPMYVDENGEEWSAPKLSALILKKLIDDSGLIIGERPEEVVITVPAYFNDVGRNATKTAGEIAGVEVLAIVNEPTAAIVAYGRDKMKDQTVVVYDLGGGTFDVTIARVENGRIEVLATAGDSDLGGVDWDNRIIEHLKKEIEGKVGPLDDIQDASIHQEIREKAESAKKSLSARKERFASVNAKGTQVGVNLTRNWFERKTADLLKKTEDKLEEVLQAAGLTWNDIDTVLLVGGSTRMPMVSDMIRRLTGKEPAMDIDPDKAVALGAALMAEKIAAEQGKDDGKGHAKALPGAKIEFVDVNAHPLGCAAILDGDGQERNAVIIPANTAIPTERTDVFALVEPDQTQCVVEVLQGKDKALKSDCLTIGQVGLQDLPPDPSRPERIEVTYKYNADGIVEVVIRDRISGKTSGGKIEHKAGLTQQEVNEAKKYIEKRMTQKGE